MVPFLELAIVILVSFGINMIPFASPSNIIIAINAGMYAGMIITADPFSLGFAVAFGAALAKLVHYAVSFFVGNHLNEKYRKTLDAKASKIRRWAFPLLFFAAASPIPDDPVVIPLGLMKYSPIKFFSAYFLGKLVIATIGAYLGLTTGAYLTDLFGTPLLIVISVVLTILVTVILLKVDVTKLIRRIFKRQSAPQN